MINFNYHFCHYCGYRYEAVPGQLFCAHCGVPAHRNPATCIFVFDWKLEASQRLRGCVRHGGAVRDGGSNALGGVQSLRDVWARSQGGVPLVLPLGV
jgi:hypothetical protein